MIGKREKIKKLFLTIWAILLIARNKVNRTILPLVDENCANICILGNGPSLNESVEEVSSCVQSSSCMCVNGFVMSEMYNVIKPKYYLLLDPSYFINDIRLDLISSRELIFDKLNNKTSWKVVLFLPFYAKNSQIWEDIFFNKNIEIHYFNSLAIDGLEPFIYLLYKYNLGMPQAQNVLVAAIFIAINMGYKKIYLYGADHSWHENLSVNNENVVCLIHNHFDNNTKNNLVPWKKGDNSGETWKLHEIFTFLSKMFGGYQILEEYSKYMGVDIYNASKKTNIDAFKRCRD